MFRYIYGPPTHIYPLNYTPIIIYGPPTHIYPLTYTPIIIYEPPTHIYPLNYTPIIIYIWTSYSHLPTHSHTHIFYFSLEVCLDFTKASPAEIVSLETFQSSGTLFPPDHVRPTPNPTTPTRKKPPATQATVKPKYLLLLS